MEFGQLASAIFYLALLGSHVQASPGEDYWQTLWPNTPMPKALRDLLQPGNLDWRGKDAYAKLGHNKDVAANTYQTGYGKVISDPARSKDTIPNGIFVFEHEVQPSEKPSVEFPKRSDKVTFLPASLEPVLLNYVEYAQVTTDELIRLQNKVPNGTFFFEQDLLPGKKLDLALMTPNSFTFLPDTVAKSIPFSSSRLPEALSRLSIEAKSTNAEKVKHAIEICERPAMIGEEKYCAKSLESLVNFAVSKLGTNIRLLSTEFDKATQDRQYVVEGVKKNGDKTVVCHKMDYPHALFYCHKVPTRSYTVSLVATGDETKGKAIAVCHTNTAHWDPKHLSFKQLNVKPGTVPVCHFLTTNTLLWVPNLALKGVMEWSVEDGN